MYSTQVVITDPLPDLKPGVSANAEIIITNIPNAVTVPIQAVTTAGGKTVVFKHTGRDPEAVPIEVGLFNTRFIEVTSGVAEGDRVLLAPPLASEQKDLGGSIVGDADDIPKEDLQANPSAVPEPTPPAESTQRTAPGGERQGGGPNREAMMKRFDKNGDGTLDESERNAMRQQFQQAAGAGAGGGGGRQREGGGTGNGGGRRTRTEGQ